MLVWVIIIIVAVWLIIKYSSKSAHHQQQMGVNSEVPNESISEETVFKAQHKFEKDYEASVDLPDAIGGRQLYIYRYLMNKWFHELSAKHRYDDAMIQKLRSDLLDYMYSVERGSTASYLAMELEDDESKEGYDEKATTYARKIYSIENAFASAVGPNAVKDLERARNLSMSAVDKWGSLAPEGHHYDWDGKLVKTKQKKTEL